MQYRPLHQHTKVDLGSALVEKFGHDKADCILDCAGVSASIDAAISNARKGSDIVVVAVFSKKESVDLGLIQDRELRLIGTLMYKKEDFLKAIDIIAKKQINIGILVTNTFGFDEFLMLMNLLKNKRSGDENHSSIRLIHRGDNEECQKSGWSVCFTGTPGVTTRLRPHCS